MKTQQTQALFIGVDVHKDTHTAVGISPFGKKVFEMKIGNYESDFKMLSEKALSEARSHTLSPYFGLEDCNGYGSRLADYLVLRHKVAHVSSVLVDRQRKRNTHPEKSDSLDARGVAEVMLRKSDTLPVYTVTKDSKKAKQIKEISMDRTYLVKEQTRLKNQVHDLLHRIFNTEYRTTYKDPFSKKALRHWMRVRPSCDPFLLRSMKRKVRRLFELRAEIKELEKEMEILLSGYTIQTANGYGIVLASIIVSEIGDIARFKSPASLAKYAGCAPREYSSGRTYRHRKTRSGNRRLNYAFHKMAFSQISRMGNDKARRYFKRKISEGKSKSQALVCLRRQMVNIVWCMMKHKAEFRYSQ